MTPTRITAAPTTRSSLLCLIPSPLGESYEAEHPATEDSARRFLRRPDPAVGPAHPRDGRAYEDRRDREDHRQDHRAALDEGDRQGQRGDQGAPQVHEE